MPKSFELVLRNPGWLFQYDPGHDFATWWRRQRTRVSVVGIRSGQTVPYVNEVTGHGFIAILCRQSCVDQRLNKLVVSAALLEELVDNEIGATTFREYEVHLHERMLAGSDMLGECVKMELFELVFDAGKLNT